MLALVSVLGLTLLFVVSQATAAVHAKSRTHATHRADAKHKSKKHANKHARATASRYHRRREPTPPTSTTPTTTTPTTTTPTTTTPTTTTPTTTPPTSTPPTSTPTPPPTTLPVSGTVLFDGTSLSSWWLNQSAVSSRIQLVPDPDGTGDTVQQFTTLNSDVAPLTPTVNPRSQLTGPLNVLKPGNAYWESFEVYVPTSMTLPSTGWIALGAPVWGAPWAGSPPAGISIDSGAFRFQTNADKPNPWQIAWTTPVVKGQWYRFTWHFLLSSTGWIQLYVNGVLQNLKYGSTTVQTMPIAMIDSADATGPWGWQEQLYYQHNLMPSATMFFKNFKIGTTQTAAEM